MTTKKKRAAKTIAVGYCKNCACVSCVAIRKKRQIEQAAKRRDRASTIIIIAAVLLILYVISGAPL